MKQVKTDGLVKEVTIIRKWNVHNNSIWNPRRKCYLQSMMLSFHQLKQTKKSQCIFDGLKMLASTQMKSTSLLLWLTILIRVWMQTPWILFDFSFIMMACCCFHWYRAPSCPWCLTPCLWKESSLISGKVKIWSKKLSSE